MSESPLQKFHGTLALLERRRQIFRLDYYKPYDYQKKFHNALGYQTDKPAIQRALVAANQVGKSFCAACETAIHLTGKYPVWWSGTRFTSPVLWVVGGKTNETVRDICQKELFGDPNDASKLGTGTVPLVDIGKRTSKPGVPNALDTCLVKHVSGKWSKVMFRAYEQGKEKHMGIRINGGWLDEEPPSEIWSQYLRATISTNGILYITFTPEEGFTVVVNGFMNDLKKGQAFVNATWNDAPHLVKNGELTDRAKQLWEAFPAHEREMRSKGVPFMGSGLIFPFTEEQLAVDPIEIPRHWPRIVGIDFGYDHAFGAVQLAWDRDSDTVYVVSDYREERAIPAIHSAAIKNWCPYAPVAWPHDGLNTEKSTGDELRQSYVDEGLNLLQSHATNPPDHAQGQEEGEGGNSVEASLMHMLERMETGKWKVFRTCKNWFEEQRIYHRKDGKIVKLKDDVISASRYAHMMIRHARTETIKRRPRAYAQGVSNWS